MIIYPLQTQFLVNVLSLSMVPAAEFFSVDVLPGAIMHYAVHNALRLDNVRVTTENVFNTSLCFSSLYTTCDHLINSSEVIDFRADFNNQNAIHVKITSNSNKIQNVRFKVEYFPNPTPENDGARILVVFCTVLAIAAALGAVLRHIMVTPLERDDKTE
ncbi:Hypothetical_protein [Hexamita inflata]|uniref:Hypothetical_protein n=1 Tax=Hexamita inflata TaxID=28002 RepID=A0AA86PD31_9EUKA|nr:Hypothetical protein HINF_LOCUS24365 [Hexamita inflata]